MDIKELRMKFGCNGKMFVDVWAECHTAQDCDQIIEWLQLAKANMKHWEKIHAKASRPAKAPTGEHETPQQGKILSAA